MRSWGNNGYQVSLEFELLNKVLFYRFLQTKNLGQLNKEFQLFFNPVFDSKKDFCNKLI